MSFHNPWMPFRYDEFESRGLSEKTMRLIHRGVQTGHGLALNEYYAWYRELNGMDAEAALIHLEKKASSPEAIRFALCQFTNINFLWLSMSPQGGQMPPQLVGHVVQDFGSIAALEREIRSVAARATTPDWLWLVKDRIESRLKVIVSNHLHTPMTNPELLPLVCLSLAESMYIFDYELDRDAFITNWISRIVNYRYAATRLGYYL